MEPTLPVAAEMPCTVPRTWAGYICNQLTPTFTNLFQNVKIECFVFKKEENVNDALPDSQVSVIGTGIA